MDETVHITLVQDWNNQNSSMNDGGTKKVPPISEELLAIDGRWGRESQLSLKDVGLEWFCMPQ